MAWLAVDKFGGELIFENKPRRYPFIEKEDKRIKKRKQILSLADQSLWVSEEDYHEWEGCIRLPIGTIKKILGKTLTWNNEPVEI